MNRTFTTQKKKDLVNSKPRLRLIGITVDISVLHWLFPKIPLEILAIFITLWVHSKYDNLIITELSNS